MQKGKGGGDDRKFLRLEFTYSFGVCLEYLGSIGKESRKNFTFFGTLPAKTQFKGESSTSDYKSKLQKR